MSELSKTNKCLWALAYMIGGSAGVYGTMLWHGVGPENVLPEPVSAVQPFNKISSAPPIKRQETRMEIGPIDVVSVMTAGNKEECSLSSDRVTSLKKTYAGNSDTVKSYQFLLSVFMQVYDCPDNLEILGVEKKHFLTTLRLAAINEVQNDFRELTQGLVGDEYRNRISKILSKASYAGISDDGVPDRVAGLKAAMLPSEADLRAMGEDSYKYQLFSDLTRIRNHAGADSGEEDRKKTWAAVFNLEDAVKEKPELAVSLGISEGEIKAARRRIFERDNAPVLHNSTAIDPDLPDSLSTPKF